MTAQSALSSPRMLVDVSAIDHNIRVVQEWCERRGVELVPHIKTTMSREIVERQIAAGATGVTVATVGQAATAHAWGCRRTLIANEILDPQALRTIAEWSGADVSVALFVDSVEGIRAASAAAAGSPIDVLVDVGSPGGRAGVRDTDAGLELARFARSSAGVRLVGVAGYEGVVPQVRSAEVLAAVERHCARAAALFDAAVECFETREPVFSMGGSAFPDVAVAHLPTRSARVVVRCGCYAIHDHGSYRAVSPFPSLRAAAVVETQVISVPEPGLAVLDAGRRDLSYDAGMPVVLDGDGAIDRLYDHHAILRDAGTRAPGETVRLGISHPCSLFDRWPRFTAVHPDGTTQTWTTEFGR